MQYIWLAGEMECESSFKERKRVSLQVKLEAEAGTSQFRIWAGWQSFLRAGGAEKAGSDGNMSCPAHGWNLRWMSFLVLAQHYKEGRWDGQDQGCSRACWLSWPGWPGATLPCSYRTGIWERETQLLSEYLSAALGLGVALNSQQIPDASCPFPKSCGHLSQSWVIPYRQ